MQQVQNTQSHFAKNRSKAQNVFFFLLFFFSQKLELRRLDLGDKSSKGKGVSYSEKISKKKNGFWYVII